MTADTTTINGLTYVASASSSAANSFDWPVWAAFNKQTTHTTPFGWATDGGLYDGSNGSYIGQNSTTIQGSTLSYSIVGEWIQLDLPYEIVASELVIHAAKPAGIPDEVTVVGSINGGSTWEICGSQSSMSIGSLGSKVVQLNAK
eukprot:scaffold257989_cov41-Tisochrysis_lutea.AAC.1